MIKTKEEALKYLRQCSKIVMPSKFTYWCHSSQVLTDKSSSNNPKMDKIWKEIPTDSFTVKNELSVLGARDRLQYVAEHKSFDAAPITYTTVPGQQGFQIKVMMPKNNLSKEEFEQLGKDQKYVQKLSYEHRGLGDGRHPKLSGKTQVHIFGAMNYDEMSKKPVQTVVGVRDEDLICYANEVQKEIAQMAQNGKVEDSAYEMPDNDVGVIEKKESFVIGDNSYQQEMNKKVTSLKIMEKQPAALLKPYNMDQLKKRIDTEYKQWKASFDPAEDRYKTIDQTIEKRKQMPFVSGFTDVKLVNGQAQTPKNESAAAQRKLLNSINAKCCELAKSINGHIDSRYSQFLFYATNDYADLTFLESALPEVEKRLEHLENYEAICGDFCTSTVEPITRKKSGLLGLLGAKETHLQSRRCTISELQDKKQADIVKLNIALAEGKINQEGYESLIESVDYLYGDQVKDRKIEKVSQEEVSKEQEIMNPTAKKEEMLMIQRATEQSQKLVAKSTPHRDDGISLI